MSAPYPFAGNRNYAIEVVGLSANTPLLLAVGTAAGSFDLTPFGIPCTLRVSLNGIVTLGAVSQGGDVVFPMPLPDDPVFVGDLYVQALMPFGPAAGATSARRIQVR